MSAQPKKLGVLVAIPIKGRRLYNRSGGKQSPYVQLKLGDQKKRTKASLIASVEPEWDQEVRLEVYQGNLDMHVALYDEGKKHELIGEGILRLHEVVDKGELDVWFVTKNKKGASSGDIYFELTFYAVAPPLPQPVAVSHPQHHPIRYNQPPQRPGFIPMNRPLPLPHAPPAPMYANNHGAPIPFPGNPYPPQPQRVYPVPPQGYSLPPQHASSRPHGNNDNNNYTNNNHNHNYNNHIKMQPSPVINTHPHTPPPFQPKTQYIPKPKAQPPNFGRSPNNIPPQMPPGNFRPQGNTPLPVSSTGPPPRFAGPGPGPQPHSHPPPMRMPAPHPQPVGPSMGYGPNYSGTPHRAPGIVAPNVQYNYNIGSFP